MNCEYCGKIMGIKIENGSIQILNLCISCEKDFNNIFFLIYLKIKL